MINITFLILLKIVKWKRLLTLSTIQLWSNSLYIDSSVGCLIWLYQHMQSSMRYLSPSFFVQIYIGVTFLLIKTGINFFTYTQANIISKIAKIKIIKKLPHNASTFKANISGQNLWPNHNSRLAKTKKEFMEYGWKIRWKMAEKSYSFHC